MALPHIDLVTCETSSFLPATGHGIIFHQIITYVVTGSSNAIGLAA